MMKSKSFMSHSPMSLSSSLRLFLVLSLTLSTSLPNTSAFVAFDRSSSCVRRFGCSAPFVGYLLAIESVAKCQKMCDANESCKFFTWRSGSSTSGMFGNFCFLFSECGDLDFECRDCWSGPRTDRCPLRRRNL